MHPGGDQYPPDLVVVEVELEADAAPDPVAFTANQTPPTPWPRASLAVVSSEYW
jgi:hypothetical protein